MKEILIVFASMTGNAEDVAAELHDHLCDRSLPVRLLDLSLHEDITVLEEADCILGVVSTWGDGEPPDDAVPFFDNLSQAEPMGLGGMPFAVLGLGDTGYDQFCECGKILERELLRHGGKPMLPRVDCDVWYEDEVESWRDQLLALFSSRQAVALGADVER
ncbi:MAG: flavodoxin domain-containing protein [Verrucomicrobiota bacterium JB023]|nr:flavodoxin domain-containing protein [Verrucomicrobiota bacterium JB023]